MCGWQGNNQMWAVQVHLTIFDKIRINNEYYNLVPRHTDAEYKLLRESIILNGQQVPIELNHRYEILDGHTRYEICRDLGIEPKFIQKTFQDKFQEKLYVIEVNLSRRQATAFQKFEMVYGQYQIEKQYSIHKTRIGTHSQTKLADRLSRNLGMSRDLFYKCQWLKKNADKQTLQKLSNGSLAITTTYLKLRGTCETKLRKLGTRLRDNSPVKCPHCHQIFKRKELIVVGRNGF